MISVASMVTGVFAWFIGSPGGFVETISGDLETDMTIDIQIDQSEIFLGDRVRDLVYITDEDFQTVGFDFYGYGAILAVNLQNSGDQAMNAKLGLYAQSAPDYGIYAGVNSGFKYLVVDSPFSVTPLMWGFQQTSNMFDAMNAHNANGVLVPANSSSTAYIIIWGYYDGLPSEQKDIYHAVVYRMRMTLFG